MDKYRHAQHTHTCIVGGCRVGLHDTKTGHLVGKEWRVESTSEHFAKHMHLPCQGGACAGTHIACEGNLTRASAFYTPKFASRAVYYMQKLGNHMSESKPQLNMSVCQCREFRWKGQSQTCPHCMYESLPSTVYDLRSDAVAPETRNNKRDPKQDSQDQDHIWAQDSSETPFSPAEKEHWLHKIRLLHSATGHGSKEVLQEALKKRKVDKRVIDLVGEFRCDTCEERKRPAPRRVATLEVHPARWKVMLADGAHWVHPVDKTRNIIGLYMDQNSRFLVGKILIQHKSSLPDAQSYVRFFNEHWQQYFGRPELLRFDAEGTWRSKSLDAAFSDLGIMLDPIPGDAHWHISPLERSIAWVKECLSKLVSENPKLDSHVALACALEAWNNREVVRGYSPRQHALGQAPDPCGRIFETDIQGLPTNMMGNPEGELAQHQRMRVEAEVAFTRWQAQQRVTRALNSRPRKVPEFAPGDLVYYWRTQLRGHHAAGEPIQTGTNAGYAGPARILAMETRRDGAQQVRPSSIV